MDSLQREAFSYFQKHANPENGLVADKSAPDSPASIAAVGLALTCYGVAVERGIIRRRPAAERVRRTLRAFVGPDRPAAPELVSQRGFYFHFLDMQTGGRVWRSEASSVDTAFLVAGALSAAAYFDRDTAEEREIRERAEGLYAQVDWGWMITGEALAHGWRPRSGFLPYHWYGYSEALLLYILALGSPTFPIPAAAYEAWTSTYHWKKLYGEEYLFAGPLFVHQLSHVWIDFRGIQDGYMRDRGIDYFENSRRATYLHREYARRNPRNFKGYGSECWGITASDGPGPARHVVDGVRRRFYAYCARGIPFGPDDGTLAPWAVVASLPFAPEIVLPAVEHFRQLHTDRPRAYGFHATFNQTYPHPTGPVPWVSPHYLGLNQGPIILMVENYRSGMVWEWMRRSPHIQRGLRRAGFQGGWLGG